MAEHANLVKVDDSRVGGDMVVPKDERARFPLQGECEFGELVGEKPDVPSRRLGYRSP
jgi:hypothetical protein